LNYGSSGNGSSIHLTTELLKMAAKIDMTHVPYKGSGPAFLDLIAGRINVLFSSTVSSLPHVSSGKVRGLAVTSLKRAPALPSIPAVAEYYTGFESSSWFGLLVPAKTPKPIVDRLLADTRAALKTPDMNQSLVSQGAEPGGDSPAEFSNYFRSEITKWSGVVKTAGIKLDQ
jgi:tripartite-type tricarboxylate transporter receptor subunit TctC